MNWQSIRLEIIITLGCNFSCEYCYNYGCPSRMHEKLSPDDVIRMLSDYKRAGGGMGVKFSGGEATLNMPALIAGIEYCRDNGIPSTLATNGWWGKERLIESYLQRFCDSGLTAIFVTRDKYHAKFGKWSDVKNVVDLSPEYGILSFILHNTRSDKYKDELIEVTEGDLEAYEDRISINSIVSCGRAQSVKQDFEQYPLACPFITSYRQTYPFISLLPGNNLCLSCIHHAGHTYEYSGSFVAAVESMLDDFMTMQRRFYYYLTEMDKQSHPFVDGCDVCEAIYQLKLHDFELPGVLLK